MLKRLIRRRRRFRPKPPRDLADEFYEDDGRFDDRRNHKGDWGWHYKGDRIPNVKFDENIYKGGFE